MVVETSAQRNLFQIGGGSIGGEVEGTEAKEAGSN